MVLKRNICCGNSEGSVLYSTLKMCSTNSNSQKNIVYACDNNLILKHVHVYMHTYLLIYFSYARSGFVYMYMYMYKWTHYMASYL